MLRKWNVLQCTFVLGSVHAILLISTSRKRAQGYVKLLQRPKEKHPKQQTCPYTTSHLMAPVPAPGTQPSYSTLIFCRAKGGQAKHTTISMQVHARGAVLTLTGLCFLSPAPTSMQCCSRRAVRPKRAAPSLQPRPTAWTHSPDPQNRPTVWIHSPDL